MTWNSGAGFPGAASSVGALVTALASRSWVATVAVGVVLWCLAYLLQQFWYSRLLKLLFPQFLGAWLIALPAALACTYFLWQLGSFPAGLAALAIVVVNWLGIWDPVLLLIMLPLVVAARRVTGRVLGDTEIAFIGVLTAKANRLGTVLNWDVYRDSDDKT